MNTIQTQMQTELGRRVMTGLIGVPAILLLITLGGRFGAALLAVVLALGMVHEYAQMALELPDRYEKRMFLLGLTWLIAFLNFFLPREEYGLLLFMFFGVFGYFLFTAGRHEPAGALQGHFRELMASVFGLLYLAFLPLFLVLIRDEPSGAHWTVLFLLIVWFSDMAGYFVGKKYGKRRLYPVISPKKSVEGAWGGVGAALLISIAYKLTLFKSLGWFGVFAIPLLVAPVSQVGDLCESFLKRAFDRKDSSSLLPGHGGFLDRFDGVLFGLPVMYACVRIFSIGTSS